MVTILYFARLKEALGTAREELALVPGTHVHALIKAVSLDRGHI